MTVYPRVGGGNLPDGRAHLVAAGLSPRGRGKLSSIAMSIASLRSIPAWAGETLAGRLNALSLSVYPRVGGGNSDTPTQLIMLAGLSPRGRGKRFALPCGNPSLRSIPAWAGETALPPLSRPRTGVYPRVGGGNRIGLRFRHSVEGLSPRGRGKLIPIDAPIVGYGSIPAWAGETQRLWG